MKSLVVCMTCMDAVNTVFKYSLSMDSLVSILASHSPVCFHHVHYPYQICFLTS